MSPSEEESMEDKAGSLDLQMLMLGLYNEAYHHFDSEDVSLSPAVIEADPSEPGKDD
jgi:hypothetical protein